MTTETIQIPRRNFFEQRWFQEILVFVTLFVLFTLNEWKDVTEWENFWRTGCYFLILFLHATLHRMLLLPILLDKHKPLTYVLSGLGLLVFFASIVTLNTDWIYPECTETGSMFLAFGNFLAACTMSLIAMLTPYIVLRFYMEQKRRATSQLCMRELELNLLHAQLNPHFLFNTFNNLYGISLQEPERIPDMIMQLSKMMRYQLENHKKLLVPLKEELIFTESYLALEEEKSCSRCEVEYNYNHTEKENGLMIAPMLILPFVENAFKHGTNCMEACYVRIHMELEDEWLHFRIVNSIPKNTQKSQPSTGIGLENARQRLHLLYPGKKHRLDIRQTETEYSVEMSLQLTAKKEP